MSKVHGTPSENTEGQATEHNNKGDNPEVQDAEYWKKQFENAEKRRRDTQAAFTKDRQALKELQEINKTLQEKLESFTLRDVNLTQAQMEELDDLRLTDPDAYYYKRKALEEEGKRKLKGEIQKSVEEASKKAKEILDEEQKATLKEEKEEFLARISSTHPDFLEVVTEEALKFDVPPRIKNKFENGQVSFSEMLLEAYDFLKGGTTVKKENTMKDPNLNKVPGSKDAGEAGKIQDFASNYKKLIF